MPIPYEFSAKDSRQIVREYTKKGFTLREIADAFGVSSAVIRNLLAASGVVIRAKGKRG